MSPVVNEDTEPLATLIGDVVASKVHGDRHGLQRSLTTILERANALLKPVQQLNLTTGDEFQGGFSDVPSAILASLVIRLELLTCEDGADSRYGLGFGEVTVFDRARSPASQDGPGWWSARAAIDRAKTLASSPRTWFARTCFGYWPERSAAVRTDAGAIEAVLLCRDAIVDQMTERQRRLMLGLMLELPQAQLAEDEGITQGAVSQNLRRSGAFAIDAAQRRLEVESE
ncbi:MAG: SatD family protein [Solirubrobacteraceae bacterium]